MRDQQYVILRKENFNSFISTLSNLHKMAAPVFKGYNNYAFEDVKSGETIALKYIPTILPPRKFFLPVHETLLEYDFSNGLNAEAVTKYEEIILFGVHTCDIAGIQCLNMVFSQHPQDHNYLIHRQNIKIIGLECNEYCDEFANCFLMNTYLPDGGYDLFLTDLGDYFIVHINTQAGEKIIETTGFFKSTQTSHLNELASFREKKKALFKNELQVDPDIIPDIFDRSFESRVWDDLDERCLACGNCTIVCPTCYCFDMKDEINLSLTAGKRYREWDSCQLGTFAKVAGGKNFRKTRKERQRHRYYRKFRYTIDRFSRFFCTGCGRCSRTCMAGIRLKETLKSLTGSKEEEKA